METVGQRLRRLRLAAGRSQRELSAPGVSYAYISRIEAGTRRPSVKALRMLAVKLGVSIEYLETGNDATTTDYLFAEVLKCLAGGRVELTAEGNRAAVVATWTSWTSGEVPRTLAAATITDALREILRVEEEALRLDSEASRIEERRRELLARTGAA